MMSGWRLSTYYENLLTEMNCSATGSRFRKRRELSTLTRNRVDDFTRVQLIK